MIFNHYAKHVAPAIVFFTTVAFSLISCSTSKETNKPAATLSEQNFDASSYINPQDYGYHLLNPNEEVPQSADSSFTPVDYDGRRMQRKIGYPSRARRMGLQGKVILEIYVDSTGTLQHIRTIKSPSSLLTSPSREAAIRADYKAAQLNQKAVNSFFRIPMLFRMRAQEVKFD